MFKWFIGDNMKKVIICLCSIILLSGCSAKIDLVINSKGKIEENIHVWNEWSNLSGYSDSKDEVLSSYRQSYSEMFKNSNYSVEYNSDDIIIEAKVNSSKNNLGNINESFAFQQLFKNIEFEEVEDGKKYTLIYSDEALSFFEDTLGIGGEEGMFFDEIELNIQFHNIVGENTSDSYDDETNTYTWLINKDNLKRNVEFVITNEKRYDIIIPYLLKKNIFVILIGVVVIIALSVVAIIMYKSKKENEI